MNIYKISCYSDCQSYFAAYLQSITVTADDEAGALAVAKEWMKKKGRKFIYPEARTIKCFNGKEYTARWDVEILAEGIQNNSVIDYLEDSDY